MEKMKLQVELEVLPNIWGRGPKIECFNAKRKKLIHMGEGEEWFKILYMLYVYISLYKGEKIPISMEGPIKGSKSG